MPSRLFAVLALLMSFSRCLHAHSTELSRTGQKYVRGSAPKVLLTHVPVIDGTAAPAVEDQNIVVENGKITAIEKGFDVSNNPGTEVLNLSGYSVMPAIVGMHNHC